MPVVSLAIQHHSEVMMGLEKHSIRNNNNTNNNVHAHEYEYGYDYEQPLSLIDSDSSSSPLSLPFYCHSAPASPISDDEDDLDYVINNIHRQRQLQHRNQVYAQRASNYVFDQHNDNHDNHGLQPSASSLASYQKTMPNNNNQQEDKKDISRFDRLASYGNSSFPTVQMTRSISTPPQQL